MLEHIDGFDTTIYLDPDLEYDSGSIWTNVNVAPGRFGGSGAGSGIGIPSLTLKKSLTPQSTRFFGAAFNFTGYYNLNTLFQWYDFTTLPSPIVQAYVGCTSEGQIYFGTGNTILGITAPFIFRTNAWYYIEAFATIGISGSYEVRLNETTILSSPNVLTQQSVNAFTDGFVIFAPFGGTNLYTIDDLYVLNTLGSKNNTFLGEQKVITSDLNSDASIQFSRNSGSTNFGQLTSMDGDATYTFSNTINQQDLFGFVPLSVSPNIYGQFYFGNDITATKLTTVARKTDVGYRNISLVLKSGSSTNLFPFSVVPAGITGFISPLLSTYEASYQIFENDPNTGVGWTKAGVNAAEVGYQLSA